MPIPATGHDNVRDHDVSTADRPVIGDLVHHLTSRLPNGHAVLVSRDSACLLSIVIDELFDIGLDEADLG